MLFEYKFVDLLESLPVPPLQNLEDLTVSGVSVWSSYILLCLSGLSVGVLAPPTVQKHQFSLTFELLQKIEKRKGTEH